MSYLLELMDLGSDVPVECRLRHILKRLLRDHHFRCTSVRMAATGHQQKQDGEQGQGVSEDTTSTAVVPAAQRIELSDTSAGECRQQHKPNTVNER